MEDEGQETEETQYEETVFMNNHGNLWFRVESSEEGLVVLLGTSPSGSGDECPVHWLQLTRRVQLKLHELLSETINGNSVRL
jgi:hypothetical protein